MIKHPSDILCNPLTQSCIQNSNSFPDIIDRHQQTSYPNKDIDFNLLQYLSKLEFCNSYSRFDRYGWWLLLCTEELPSGFINSGWKKFPYLKSHEKLTAKSEWSTTVWLHIFYYFSYLSLTKLTSTWKHSPFLSLALVFWQSVYLGYR